MDSLYKKLTKKHRVVLEDSIRRNVYTSARRNDTKMDYYRTNRKTTRLIVFQKDHLEPTNDY